MKTPEEIAREIVGECVFTRFECSPCTPKTDPKCHKCGMVDRIAAAIAAERTPGTTGEPAATARRMVDCPDCRPNVFCGTCGGEGQVTAPVDPRQPCCGCVRKDRPRSVATCNCGCHPAGAARDAGLSDVGKDRKATGELSVATAPAPACHNDKPGDPCPCGANFTRCPPEGTPPDGVEIVGGKIVCARCGGRGCVPRVHLNTGTVGEDDCPACGGSGVLPCPYLREECLRRKHEAKHTTCPECGGKP